MSINCEVLLRRALPAEGIVDVRVKSLSRSPPEMKERTSQP